MSIDRSPEMIKLAYFMAKYGNTVGDKVKPPSEMGVKTWVEAYRRLFRNWVMVVHSRRFKEASTKIVGTTLNVLQETKRTQRIAEKSWVLS